MKIEYYEDTDSFAISLSAGSYDQTATVTDDFFVDLDGNGRISGVESISARRHLRIDDLLLAPPRFRWVQLAENEPGPLRLSDRDRYFVYRTDQDTLFMEFAGGEPADTVQMTDGIDALVDDEGRVVGLDVSDASRNLDLRNILAGGFPQIEWVAHPATAAAVTI